MAQEELKKAVELIDKNKSLWSKVSTHNVIPIIVAVITAIGSLKYISYRFDELKDEKAEKGMVIGMMHRMDEYMVTQNKVNDLILKLVANKGYIAQQKDSQEKTMAKTQLETYYGYQANVLMQELKTKEELRKKDEVKR